MQDVLFNSGVGVSEFNLDQEAIEFGFGQRISALELHGILGGKNGEFTAQFMRHAVHRDSALLHRLEQRRLGLGGRTVDLVGEDQVTKKRARPEGELAIGTQDAHAGHVRRHEIRRELDAAESETQAL